MFSFQALSPIMWVASLWSLLILLHSDFLVWHNHIAQFCLLCALGTLSESFVDWFFFFWELFLYRFLSIQFLVLIKCLLWYIMFKGQSLCTNVTVFKIEFTFLQPSIHSWISIIWWQNIRQVYYSAFKSICDDLPRLDIYVLLTDFYHNYNDSTEVYFEFS